METLQKQITALSVKIDGLYQIIEQLTQNVTELLSESKLSVDRKRLQASTSSTYADYLERHHSTSNLEHKDILNDSGNLDSSYQNGEKQIGPEIQIQRLTAQVTAAYNRIADLEEQLLAQRVHWRFPKFFSEFVWQMSNVSAQ